MTWVLAGAFVLLAVHDFVSGRLIYWQRCLIEALEFELDLLKYETLRGAPTPDPNAPLLSEEAVRRMRDQWNSGGDA